MMKDILKTKFSREQILDATISIFQQMELKGWLKEGYQNLQWENYWTELGKESLNKVRQVAHDLGFGMQESIDIPRLKSVNEALHVFDPQSSSCFSFLKSSTKREFAEFWVYVIGALNIGDDLVELYAFVLIAIRHGKIVLHPYSK